MLQYLLLSTDMQTKIEISEHKIEQQSLALEEKEREAVRRVQAAREEEFTKFTQAENEKSVSCPPFKILIIITIQIWENLFV